MRFRVILLLVAALLPSTVRAAATCAPLGHLCASPTNTSNPPCCAGLLCKHTTGWHCVAGPVTTTTVSTTTSTSTGETSTTIPGQTTTTVVATTTTPTSTTLPVTGGFSFLFTPADLAATALVPAGFSGDVPDPTTGDPASEFLLATMTWQLEAYSMEMVAAADAAGCPFNQQQIEDANYKFGGDYVLMHQPFPSGGSYPWLHPTYVRQYTLEPILGAVQCLQDHHMLSTDLAQLAGVMGGPRSLSPGVAAGPTNYDANAYPPLTPAQCAALDAADNAHNLHDQDLIDHNWPKAEADNPAVLATQRSFEATAIGDEGTLFKWVWAPNYNRANPQEVLDGLTKLIIEAHHAAHGAYNCDTGAAPDVAKIMHYELLHNFLHDCRATTHWLDTPIPTVCSETQIQSCPKLTCRQWSQQPSLP